MAVMKRVRLALGDLRMIDALNLGEEQGPDRPRVSILDMRSRLIDSRDR